MTDTPNPDRAQIADFGKALTPWGIDASNPSAVKLDDTRFRMQGRDRAKDGGRDA